MALAHQNSMSSQLDLQVIAAILNAHLTAVDGSEALDELQQETEAAVRTRSDLDTLAGARDFQRFLIGKLRDIREVVATASLDDTSKATLMAAWTSLYNASKQEASSPGDAQTATEPAAGTGPDADRAAGLISGDPLLDSLLFDDPGLVDEATLPQGAAPSARRRRRRCRACPAWATDRALPLRRVLVRSRTCPRVRPCPQSPGNRITPGRAR
ncbi:hypothetical protein I551_0115 [Mycobacterium ulcerans str. Harvey]|uniref:Uncharacterized protein n=1 Tax=Mycobacterium ulcerans str. Harvey TaxID=1299332 RepID=A0ABN0R8Q7_MYCUL|nr:hypothetical protein I551_0115 [Mycobacterium ulcerans str. Harvey]